MKRSHTKAGRLTPHGLNCGLSETFEYGPLSGELSQWAGNGKYSVRVINRHTGQRIAGEIYYTLTDARKAFDGWKIVARSAYILTR